MYCLNGKLRDCSHIGRDRRERRGREAAFRGVVPARYGDVAWHAHFGFPECAKQTYCQEIIRADHRIDLSRLSQQQNLLSASVALLAGIVALCADGFGLHSLRGGTDDEFWVFIYVGSGEGAAVTFET